MISWYDKPPSRAQLRYLKNLGYVEPAPLSMAEASAAIDEMLQTADPATAYQEILAERHERQALFADFENEGHYRTEQKRSAIVWLLTSPFVVVGHLLASMFWLFSRLVATTAWMISMLATALIWLFTAVGLLARRSAAATVKTGRERIIPWIGGQDWHRMAVGCRVQLRAAISQVDRLLSEASGDDRFLLLILRFATAAGAVIAAAAFVLFAL